MKDNPTREIVVTRIDRELKSDYRFYEWQANDVRARNERFSFGDKRDGK